MEDGPYTGGRRHCYQSPVSLLVSNSRSRSRTVSQTKTRNSQNREKTLGWPSILSKTAEMNGFDIPGFPGRKRGFSGFCTISHFLDDLMQKDTVIPYVLSFPYPDKKAGCNLEGGFEVSNGGLGYSRRPCATRLSVAGLLDINHTFPGREGVYSGGKRGLFCRQEGGNC